MTVPTKAAMKQLLDERMIAGSASNWLPPAMFFLQLNLSGVIILLSLMFYANALGESFVRGLVVVFCSSVVWCMCGYVLWLNVCTVLGGSIWHWCVCVCVWYCFLSTLKIFAFLWTLPVLPWLFPVCIRVFSHGDHTAQVTSHAAWRGGSWCSLELAFSSLHSFSREEKIKRSMRTGSGCFLASDSSWFSTTYWHETQCIGMVSLWYMKGCDPFVCFGLWLNPVWTFKVTKKTPTNVSFVLSIAGSISVSFPIPFPFIYHRKVFSGAIYDDSDDNNTTLSQFLTDNSS